MTTKKHEAPAVRVRRIYDGVADDDGARILVDRVWPRGVSKDRAQLTAWYQDVAPTTELRRWFSHAPEKFNEFARRYREQLQAQKREVVVEELRKLASERRLTLLTAAKRDDISHAEVLRQVLSRTN